MKKVPLALVALSMACTPKADTKPEATATASSSPAPSAAAASSAATNPASASGSSSGPTRRSFSPSSFAASGPEARDNVAVASGVDFSGTFHSSNGTAATVVQTDAKVTITYDKGEAKCTAGGSTLECTWTQPDKSGRAILILAADGVLHGTWGDGESTTDGGAWGFFPPDHETKELPEGVAFEGRYQSSYGGEATVATKDDGAVVVTYPKGEAQCVAIADLLNCAWQQPDRAGRAIFVRNDNGSLFGNWGNGDSYANGGVWTLTPIQSGASEPEPAPEAQPETQPETPPASPGELGPDGLPVAIPAPGSSPPTVAEWNAVPKEITVRYSSTLGCETKMVREWLRVSCRPQGEALPVSVQTTRSSGQQAYPGMFGDRASLVMQVVINKEYEAAFGWTSPDGDFAADLVVSWPNGAPRPSIYFR